MKRSLGIGLMLYVLSAALVGCSQGANQSQIQTGSSGDHQLPGGRTVLPEGATPMHAEGGMNGAGTGIGPGTGTVAGSGVGISLGGSLGAAGGLAGGASASGSSGASLSTSGGASPSGGRASGGALSAAQIMTVVNLILN